VRRAYARGDYWDERVKLMAWWADYLDTLRQGGCADIQGQFGRVKPPLRSEMEQALYSRISADSRRGRRASGGWSEPGLSAPDAPR
jgi:hypothetical protein